MRISNVNCLRSLAAVVLVAGGLITAAAPPANADGDPDPHATQAVTAIDLLAKRSEYVGAREVGRRTDLRSARGGYQYAGSEDAVVTVSKSTGMVDMHGGRHDLTVQVGGVGSSTLVGGDVVMDSAHGYSVIPAPHRDGSVQVIVVIASRSSPARYDFTIGSDVASTIQVLSSGSALVLDVSGNVIAGAAPAWAFDAKGRRVPTHYEVSGDTLVQVIEHASQDFDYPIVADPWLGLQLFDRLWRDTYKGDWRYNGDVSAWGAAVMWGIPGTITYEAGQLIMNTLGWDEWVAKYPAITNKATLKQQYACHVKAGTIGLPFTGTYNLERVRANKSDWVWTVWSHRCNW